MPFLKAFAQNVVSSLPTASIKDKLNAWKILSTYPPINAKLGALNDAAQSCSPFTPEQEARFLKIDEEFLVFGYGPDDLIDDPTAPDINDLDEGSL